MAWCSCGSGFAALDEQREASRVWCKFGPHEPRPAVWHNNTCVECDVPTLGGFDLGVGEHLVQISLNGVDWEGARRTEPTVGEQAAGADFAGGTRRDAPFAPALAYIVYQQPGSSR